MLIYKLAPTSQQNNKKAARGGRLPG